MKNDLLEMIGSEYALTPSQRRRLRSRYRAKGHAAPPGTGPAGETCKTCKNLTRISYAKDYLKCELMRAVWTGSYGTDVRASDPACAKWGRREKPGQ